jgi:hypothetical protein
MGQSLLMQRHFVEEEATGDILIVDRNGREVARFAGDEALQRAIDWAKDQNLTLYSSVSPTTLFDHQNLYLRRRPRLARRGRNFPASSRPGHHGFAPDPLEPLVEISEESEEVEDPNEDAS